MKIIGRRSTLAFGITLLLGGMVLAVDRVGTTLYSVRTDPITDDNTSSVLLPEVNDTTASTYLRVYCRGGTGDVFLVTKNPLYDVQDARLGLFPSVQYRVDTRDPVTEDGTDGATTDGVDDPTTLAFTLSAEARLLAAMSTGSNRLALRVLRTEGRELTYIFSLSGFASAWSRVNACRNGSARASTITVTPPSAGAGAPKFNRWYFTTCSDAQTGAIRSNLVAGRAHLCELVIETTPNGARPLNAEFRYELEYREGGVSKKLTLDSVDRWSSSGGGLAKFRQEGSRLVFTLPLNVRARAERVYTTIGVVGTVNFDNGSSKRVYEPLSIK